METGPWDWRLFRGPKLSGRTGGASGTVIMIATPGGARPAARIGRTGPEHTQTGLHRSMGLSPALGRHWRPLEAGPGRRDKAEGGRITRQGWVRRETTSRNDRAIYYPDTIPGGIYTEPRSPAVVPEAAQGGQRQRNSRMFSVLSPPPSNFGDIIRFR